MEKNVLVDNARTQAYVNRFGSVGHFKILREDVADPSKFEKAFDLPSGTIGELPEQSIVMHSMYANWNSLQSELASSQSPELGIAQNHYLEERQALGLANILNILRHDDRAPTPLNLAQFLHYMNAAASLDGPGEGFARLPYEHPTVQRAMLLDWKMIKAAINIFNKNERYKELLDEGVRRFEQHSVLAE